MQYSVLNILMIFWTKTRGGGGCGQHDAFFLASKRNCIMNRKHIVLRAYRLVLQTTVQTILEMQTFGDEG